MRRPLVSIVTPCYNGEAFLDRYFECVLAQTYPSIELIFVDDGSTDQTFELAKSYRHALESRGYRSVFLRQEHAGQAAAINLGLPHVTGAYLTWPDSDDLMRPDNIEKKVQALEAHPEAGFVRCQVDIVDERNVESVLRTVKVDDTSSPWLFERLLHDDGTHCLNLAYLVRSDALFKALNGRKIVASPAGQNLQMLLPLAYHYPCIYIDEPLASYVQRSGSHSKRALSIDQKLERNTQFEKMLKTVIENMRLSGEETLEFKQHVDAQFLPARFDLTVQAGDFDDAAEIKKTLEHILGKSPRREALHYACKAGLGPAALRCLNFLRALKGSLTKLTKGRG